MTSNILKIKKINLQNNCLLVFRDLKINLSKGEVYFSVFKNLKPKEYKRNDKSSQFFFAITGKFNIEVLDSNFKKKKSYRLTASDNKVLYVKNKSWYRIIPQIKKSILFNQTNFNKVISRKFEKKLSI